MIHCHNLVHEDHDMMVQFQVGNNRDDNDPRLSDPCKNMPDPDFEDEPEEEAPQSPEDQEAAERAADEFADASRSEQDALEQALASGPLEGTTS